MKHLHSSANRSRPLNLPTRRSKRRVPLVCAVSIALFAAIAVPPADAATVLWTGLGGNSNWSTVANWAGGGVGVGGVPGTGDTPLFDGTGVTNNNDLVAATTLLGLTFASTAGAFTLNGNSINSTGGIFDYSLSTETINLELIFASTHTLHAATGGSLVIGGTNGFVSGAGGITKTGGGTVTFNGSGTNVNTYTGATTLNAGTLSVTFQ